MIRNRYTTKQRMCLSEIAGRLSVVNRMMRDVAGDMAAFSDVIASDEMLAHSKELNGAGEIAMEWVRKIRGMANA